jgi:aminoglycoside phosphotransferase family enzyme/predicted kinase
MKSERSAESANNTTTGAQDSVLEFLGAASDVKRIDTHASVVFLDEHRALKIKRAVRLPFLDYSTLPKRKAACEEELRVNAVNAPELYRRVVAITREHGGRLEVDGAGTPIEWAVEMARFDEGRTLDCMAKAGTIEPALAAALADAILQSHDRAPRADGETWIASIPSIIDRNTAKFRTLRELDAASIDQLDARSHDLLARVGALLGRRAGQGFVRRGHGDLHLANVAMVDGKPRLFDAIEFDALIATTDVLYDLAFTLMDLVHFNNAVAANVLFNHYLAAAAHEHLDGLGTLPLFLSMRAAIRAHVLFTKSEQGGDGAAARHEAKRYFDLASRLIVPKPPRMLAIGGLSGTGKSVLARGLAGMIEPPPGAVIIRSDVVRKKLFDVSETTALPERAYLSGTSARVYEAMHGVAQRILAQGMSVVIDASFMEEEQRRALRRLAREHKTHFVGLFLTADIATRLARIDHRKHDASDATREVALKQEATAIGAVNWHAVDASGTPDDTLRRSMLHLGAARI